MDSHALDLNMINSQHLMGFPPLSQTSNRSDNEEGWNKGNFPNICFVSI